MTNTPFDVTIQVAEVTDAEPFPEAEKPEMVKLWLDLGDESLRPQPNSGTTTTRQTSSAHRFCVRRTSDRFGLPDSNPKR